MPIFIEVKDSNDGDIAINPDHIRFIKREYKEERHHILVAWTDGSFTELGENYDVVLSKFRHAGYKKVTE